MNKIKQVLQHDERDCGAACISIILQYYGKVVPLRKICTACGTDSEGTSGYGIVKGAQKFGLSCKGLMSPKKDKLEQIPLPAIFHINEHADHYAVDSKENIIVCPSFIGIKNGILGNLKNGFDEEKKILIENLYADKIEYCKKCWARYVCGGECFAVGFNNNGIFEKPVEAMCCLKKHLIQLSVYFWTRLRYEHEEIYKSCLEKY